MFDLISANAYAQGGGNDTMAAVGNVIFLVMLFGIFYFLLIRPQQKQAKLHKEMVDNLQRGDSVVTGAGFLGRIHRVEEDILVVEIGEVEIAPKNYRPVRVKVKRISIASLTAKAGAASGGEATPAE